MLVLGLALLSVSHELPVRAATAMPQGPRPEAGGFARPWMQSYDAAECLSKRIPPPRGYARTPLPPASFGAWLRGLPLKPGAPPVYLHDGRKKAFQGAHVAVIDLDVGRRDLQQCADFIIRLRAEYLWAVGLKEQIQFRFSNGEPARLRDWQAGMRPVIQGNRVHWVRRTGADGSYAGFRRYLETVFAYAGTASLSRELEPVAKAGAVEVGDVIVAGGFPGHAVLVVDLARPVTGRGDPVVLLAQSYIPAQEGHVLKNLVDASLSPWYRLDEAGGDLATPEWVFRALPLKRWKAGEGGSR